MTTPTTATATTEMYKKATHIGHHTADGLAVWIETEISHNGSLSITGVIGPKRNGDSKGPCGQIVEDLKDTEFLPGIDGKKLIEVWERWHLNGMRAGSPDQADYIRANPELFEVQSPVSHYENACKVLESAGLHPSPNYTWDRLVAEGMYSHAVPEFKAGRPYGYGHAWLKEQLPQDIVDFIRALSDDSDEYPWINSL